MVAGMVMPLDNLKAIYEHLFRDGVMVAKKDKRPQTKHPEIPGVDNLQVIRAMGSLKSRGYVRETFAWKHYYWYLTNEGIVYLRDYLHLPPEIIPTPLQRVQRPAATLAIGRRAERVQTVQGPTSYVPKPGKVGAEKQEALLDRQEYRRKMASMDDAEMTESNERTPRFRGRPMAGAQIRPRESKEQPMLSDTRDNTKEMDTSVRRKVAIHLVSQMPSIETHHAKPVKQEKMVELKECTKMAFVQKTQKVNVSQDVPTISSNVGATAAESSLFSVHTEAVKEKPKEEVSIKVSHVTTYTAAADGKMAKDARHSIPSKPKVEKAQKNIVMKNVQNVPAISSAVETSLFSVHTEAVKEKPKEDILVKVFQQTTSTETVKDAPQPTASKLKVENTQRTTVAKNVQEASSTVEATSGKYSVSAVPTEAAKEKPNEELFIKISKKTTSAVADNSKMAKDAPGPTISEQKVEKMQQTLVPKSVPAVSSAVETTAMKSSVLTEAFKEKPKEDVCIKVPQITSKTDKDNKSDKDASHPIPLQPKVDKTQKTTKTKNVQDIATVSSNVEATAVQSTIFPVTARAAEEKPKEKVETTPKGDSKIYKDPTCPTLSKSKVEKTQQAPVTKNLQDVVTISSGVETSTVKSSVSAKAVQEKPKEEMCVSVFQETTPKGDGKIDKDPSHLTASKPKAEKTQKTKKTKKVSQEIVFTVTDDSQMAKGAPHPTLSKSKVEETQKTKNMQDVAAASSTGETTAVKSSAVSVFTEAVKEDPKEEVCVSVSQKTTPKGDSEEGKDAPHSSKPKVEKMQKNTKTKSVQDIPTVLSTAVQSSAVSVPTEAVKEKTKEDQNA
ncbi:protein hsr-9-like [Carassius carassius]|uniref:protein hsr-9-like n=1 Tax=Carassius carassius TaxID=217509 RepID=UPI00286891ED|nr:protein hsr-9-like [Carassius carassius]